jgi:protein gp37
MSNIEWTDATWNPIIGCSRISEECRNCYAATAAASPRLQQFPQYKGVEEWDGTINFAESQLRKPLSWRNPKRIFVCSMPDLFHENIPDEWRDRIFAVMELTPRHTYQVLTKRTARMVEYFSNNPESRILRHAIAIANYNKLQNLKLYQQVTRSLPFSNVWLGTTAGCQSSVNERLPLIDKLTRQGWTTFVSAEPLLEPISLGLKFPGFKISQVITGAESGSGARPMEEDWVRDLRDQCVENDVAFFYKQDFKKGRKISLPELDGKQWIEFPVPKMSRK